MNPPPAKLIRGHPLFYGAGELDEPHYPRAKRASQLYAAWGADVTFEGWRGETHSLSPNWLAKTKMREWLIAHGPEKQVESGFETAQTAEKRGRLGEAFTLYAQIVEILPDTELCRISEKSAKRLAAQANVQLDILEKTADEKPYVEVVKGLAAVRQTYAGSIFAERAAQLLTKLLNAKADALEVRAREAEAQKDYVRAIQLYELYLTYFAEAARYSEVERHLKVLKKRTTP